MKRLVALTLLTASMAGCGGSDADPTTTVPVATTATTVTTSTIAPTTAAETTTSTTEPSVETTSTTTTTTLPDTEPPELVVTSPAMGATVADPEVVFRGTVEPGVQGVWSPPDHEAVVDADGNWEVAITLSSGHNNIVFSALDQAGNEAIVEQLITYTAPMPCEGAEVLAEHGSTYPVGPKSWCGGWGYIESMSSSEIVFDLIQVDLNVPGDESQGWSFVNANPMLRWLPFSSTVEIRACAPEAGSSAPGICGNPWVGWEGGYSLWTVADLDGFVAASDELWRVYVDSSSGQVVWVEQWWIP